MEMILIHSFLHKKKCTKTIPHLFFLLPFFDFFFFQFFFSDQSQFFSSVRKKTQSSQILTYISAMDQPRMKTIVRFNIGSNTKKKEIAHTRKSLRKKVPGKYYQIVIPPRDLQFILSQREIPYCSS